MSEQMTRKALLAARQFILNGIEMGYIRMPDADTPDPAHNTLPMIEAALSQREAVEPFGYVVYDSEYRSEDFTRVKPDPVFVHETVVAVYTAAPSREVPEEWRHAVSDLMATVATHPSCQKGMVNRCVCRACAMLRARALLASKGGA